MRDRLTAYLGSLYGRSREAKLVQFVNLCGIQDGDTILDVGINPEKTHAFENMVEQRLAHTCKIVAVSLDNPAPLKADFPTVSLVQANGCQLPFPDNAFKAVYANAVIEHVGAAEAQRGFVAEMVRVADCGVLTTPNYWFPIEVHSKLPMVQYLPTAARRHVFARVKGPLWPAYMDQVHLLSARRFRALFPPTVEVTIIRHRVTFWPETLAAHFRHVAAQPEAA